MKTVIIKSLLSIIAMLLLTPLNAQSLKPLSQAKRDSILISIAKKVLQRIEQNNTNNKTGVKLFGEGYSRMTNTIYLEKDFLSQYYTIGIIGILLFILPYILIPFISLFYILFKKNRF